MDDEKELKKYFEYYQKKTSKKRKPKKEKGLTIRGGLKIVGERRRKKKM